MDVFCHADGMDLFCIWNPAVQEPAASLYLSAGIHGDEPAATEALVEWAESATTFLKTSKVLIFPCLNPWGLQWNCRLDAKGRDLNRQYHSNRLPRIAAQKRLISKHGPFDLGMALHEDYDACGVYLYEIQAVKPFLGERILVAASRHMILESRTTVEGSRCRNGLIRRKIDVVEMPEHPEAFFLHFGQSSRTFTLETPSEFSIHDRVDAQIAALRVLEEFVKTGR